MFTRHYRKVKFLFALADLLVTALAFEAAYQTRQRLALYFIFYLDKPVKALLLGISLFLWVAGAHWSGLYERLDAASPATIVRDTFRQCVIGAAGLVVAEYLLRLDLSRMFVAVFAAYAWVLLCLFHLNAERLAGAFRREFGARHYVMVVGSGVSAQRVGRLLEASVSHGIRLQGFFTLDGEPDRPIVLARSYETFSLDRLPGMLKDGVLDEIIFAVESGRLAGLEEVFLLCDEEGIRTRVMLDFFPHVNSEVYLDHLGPASMLTFAAAPHDEIRLLFKRLMDIVLAAAALLLSLPFMALIGTLIRLTSKGPAIFRQERCGLSGRRFVVYKFRSMCDDAEHLKAALLHLSDRTTAFKIADDPRRTALGRFLRKFSIDEWPQLWNVLKGDMSLVGPRPAVPEEVEQYARWQRRRLRMRPGLTCLWVVNGRDSLDFDTWMKMDMQYIDSWSLGLDWKIILQTIPRVLTGKGAH